MKFTGLLMLIAAGMLFVFAFVLALLGLPPIFVLGVYALSGLIGCWGFFSWFSDYFHYLNDEANRRHGELIRELRRIYPPAPRPAPPHQDTASEIGTSPKKPKRDD